MCKELVEFWASLRRIESGACDLYKGSRILLAYKENEVFGKKHYSSDYVITAERTTYRFGIFPHTMEEILLIAHPYCLERKRILRFELFDKHLLDVLVQEREWLRNALDFDEVNIDHKF